VVVMSNKMRTARRHTFIGTVLSNFTLVDGGFGGVAVTAAIVRNKK
jgi:hypothetical protein